MPPMAADLANFWSAGETLDFCSAATAVATAIAMMTIPERRRWGFFIRSCFPYFAPRAIPDASERANAAQRLALLPCHAAGTPLKL